MTSTFPPDLPSIQNQSSLAHDYPGSFVAVDGAALWLEADNGSKRLAIMAERRHPFLTRFSGQQQMFAEEYVLQFCRTDAANAAELRRALPWLEPRPLGLVTSAGFGDRLGLATPGHVRALQNVSAAGGRGIAPLFAQQSIREMSRTHRTPLDVLTDATWGTFQAGWQTQVGADADHLKTPADVDATVAAGYSFYTIDPGEYVDSAADDASAAAVQRKLDALPWADLESDPADLLRRYAGQATPLEDREIVLDTETVARAAAKYGAAVAHISRMYRHLAGKDVPFELEISVDETDTPTTHGEHVYLARELQRLGVRWVSLAPRYVGRFEKGVDYIGDLAALREDLAVHAAIARALGPYKLSLHSGSDKFSVYPLITEVTGGQVHLKTAGTSYLEALRVVAQVDPGFFRQILDWGRDHYEQDKVSYHVSAELSRVPPAADLPDAALPSLLDDFDARQVLHVTFGSALSVFGPQLLALLRTDEEAYNRALETHFVRHLAPFAAAGTPAE